MPSTKPFKGLVYNAKKVKDISKVLAPPYDVISKDMQESLYRLDPHNVVRLILGKIKKKDTARGNRYTRAKIFFDSWLKKHILTQDTKKALYIYSQTYEDFARPIERIGFIGLMALDLVGNKKILPHENTLLAPKIDRLDLMRSVRANLSPIFVLYEDKTHNILNILTRARSKEAPFIDVGIDGIRHRVWRLKDARLIGKIDKAMRSKDIFIADGHHRYEVARTYAIESRDKNVSKEFKKNSGYMMAYFVESEEKMLTILPTHRLIKHIGILSPEDIRKRLDKFFLVKKASSMDNLLTDLQRLKSSCAFGLYMGDRLFYVLKLKDYAASDRLIKNKPRDWKRLDVTILHLFLLEYVLGIRDDEDNIEFVKDAPKAKGLVDAGRYRLAFFLNPTKVSQVKRIAKLGQRMPRKATYFYPKPLSGLVINKLAS